MTPEQKEIFYNIFHKKEDIKFFGKSMVERCNKDVYTKSLAKVENIKFTDEEFTKLCELVRNKNSSCKYKENTYIGLRIAEDITSPITQAKLKAFYQVGFGAEDKDTLQRYQTLMDNIYNKKNIRTKVYFRNILDADDFGEMLDLEYVLVSTSILDILTEKEIICSLEDKDDEGYPMMRLNFSVPIMAKRRIRLDEVAEYLKKKLKKNLFLNYDKMWIDIHNIFDNSEGIKHANDEIDKLKKYLDKHIKSENINTTIELLDFNIHSVDNIEDAPLSLIGTDIIRILQTTGPQRIIIEEIIENFNKKHQTNFKTVANKKNSTIRYIFWDTYFTGNNHQDFTQYYEQIYTELIAKRIHRFDVFTCYEIDPDIAKYAHLHTLKYLRISNMDNDDVAAFVDSHVVTRVSDIIPTSDEVVYAFVSINHPKFVEDIKESFIENNSLITPFRGIKDVRRCHPMLDNNRRPYMIINGVTLDKFLTLEFVDVYSTISNVPQDVMQNLGLDAAIKVLCKELEMCISSGNVSPQNKNAIRTIVSTITFYGKISSVNRRGMEDLGFNYLTRLSFENVMDTMSQTEKGVIDPLKDVTSSIIVGFKL